MKKFRFYGKCFQCGIESTYIEEKEEFSFNEAPCLAAPCSNCYDMFDSNPNKIVGLIDVSMVTVEKIIWTKKGR